MIEEMIEPEWEERPYGWKKKLGEKSQLLRLKPYCNTSVTVKPELRGPYGLKANNAVWEHVEHQGTIEDENDASFSLTYTSFPLVSAPNERPSEMEFAKGGRFYSVLPDARRTGYYHDLKNVSGGIIQLKIEWE